MSSARLVGGVFVGLSLAGLLCCVELLLGGGESSKEIVQPLKG